MTITAFPNGVSSFGVPVLGGGSIVTTGSIFFVDSATGSDTNAGTDPSSPLATIDAAVGKCTANKGDHIVVMPGHAESISAAGGLTLDVAGVTIVGLGKGNNRPTITLDTANTADIDVTTADVRIENVIFSANFADIVECFDLSAAGFTLVNCAFRETAVNMNFVDIIKTTTTDNECDRLTIINCEVIGVDVANDALIEVNGDLDSLTFVGNYVRLGTADGEAVIMCATGKDLTNIVALDNVIYRLNTTGDIFIQSDTTANSGIVGRNLVAHADTLGEIPIDCDGAYLFENYASGVTSASGYLLPAADS